MKKSELNYKQILEFMESMRTLGEKQTGPKKMISIRLPENLIEALKKMALIENKKYQHLIVESIENYLHMKKKESHT